MFKFLAVYDSDKYVQVYESFTEINKMPLSEIL